MIKLHHLARVKTPLLLQIDRQESGAAALGIILSYYKKYITLEQLRIDCDVLLEGASIEGILAAAKKYQLKTQGHSLRAEQIDFNTPSIICMENDRFMVLEGIINNMVYINDPAVGKIKIKADKFIKTFKGVLITFEPDADFVPSGHPNTIFPFLTSHLKGQFAALTYILLCGFALTCFAALTPLFTKIFIDQYLISEIDSFVKPLIVSMGVIALMQIYFLWLQSYHHYKLTNKLAIIFSSASFWHLLRLPYNFFAQRFSGDLANRMMLNDKLAAHLVEIFVSVFLNGILLVLYLMIMFYFDVTLTWITILIGMINMLLILSVAQFRKEKSDQILTDAIKYQGYATNGIQRMESLKAQGREIEFFSKISGIQAAIANITQTLSNRTMWVGVLPEYLVACNMLIIVYVGAIKVMHSQITVGTLFAFQLLSLNFIKPLQSLFNTLTSIQSMSGTIDKLNDVMHHALESELENVTQSEQELFLEPAAKFRGKVEFDNVQFSYTPFSAPILKGMNLSIQPSERIAIVGPSGSGKSTIAKLMVKLYPVSQGQIRIDDRDINDINRMLYVNSCAMVDQFILIFKGSILENIAMWDTTISRGNIMQAAMDADIHEYIASLPLGYDALLDEGGNNISGGQKQKIEIARALVRDPSIIILDEATSSLDPASEKKILTSLKRRGCTTITIAHRLSAFKDADKIFVVSEGQVVEIGTHETLLAAQGLYTQLIEAR